MFGLAEDTDLSELVGCRMQSLLVGLHQVNLNLDGLRDIVIAVEGDFAVARQGEAEVRYSSAPEGAVALMALLDVEIVAVSVERPGTTVLSFANGAVVSIYDSEPDYESYQIHIGPRVIVV